MIFDDKIVLVTGAASGIGAATARQLGGLGATVIVADISEPAGEAMASSIREEGGGQASFVKMDVSDWKGVETAFETIRGQYGRLDILVNNAGTGTLGLVPDIDIAEWQRVLAITLNGVFHCCKAAIPMMREAGEGTIVNVASVSGLAGDHALPAYNAAKAGVVNLTRSMAIAHISEGIRINCVCPGLVDTPGAGLLKDGAPELWSRILAAYPISRALEPSEIAEVIIFLASPASSALVGASVVADGGVSAWTGVPNYLA